MNSKQFFSKRVQALILFSIYRIEMLRIEFISSLDRIEMLEVIDDTDSDGMGQMPFLTTDQQK
jgi:hypothetical protein